MARSTNTKRGEGKNNHGALANEEKGPVCSRTEVSITNPIWRSLTRCTFAKLCGPYRPCERSFWHLRMFFSHSFSKRDSSQVLPSQQQSIVRSSTRSPPFLKNHCYSRPPPPSSNSVERTADYSILVPRTRSPSQRSSYLLLYTPFSRDIREGEGRSKDLFCRGKV